MADCVLCQIIDGTIPSKKIYEDDDIVAILDFNGANPGHSFVIPKQHIPILEQVPSHLVGKLFNISRSRVYQLVKKKRSWIGLVKRNWKEWQNSSNRSKSK